MNMIIIQIVIISHINCTNTENEDITIIFKYLLLSMPSSILLFSLISFMVYILIKPLFNNKKRWKNFCTQMIQLNV